MKTAYELNKVVFSYGGPPTLAIDHLRISAGEALALVGPNGSGKTTLLHLLAFLITPQTGDIFFFGSKTDRGSLLGLRRRVGLLLQNPYLFNMTALGNLLWGLRVRGVAKSEARELSLEALDRVGLAGFEHRQVRTLSGGESQRVALARAIVLNPDVLLLDEPATHMDRESIERTEEIVLEMNKNRGKTVIITTHNPSQVQHVAHSFLHIFQGSCCSAAPDNLFKGSMSEDGTVFDTGNIKVSLPASVISGNRVSIDPSRISLSDEMLSPEPANCFKGSIVALSEENGSVRTQVQAGERFHVLIPADSPEALDLRLGRTVWLTFNSDAVEIL
jgi:tungstate transport system ATP-binding protein